MAVAIWTVMVLDLTPVDATGLDSESWTVMDALDRTNRLRNALPSFIDQYTLIRGLSLRLDIILATSPV
jgi:hypothetical protein